MINLFERNDQKARDLLYSLAQAGFERPTIFLEDDGWLPKESESPFMYFAKRKKSGRPRYFNEIKVPRYWEILGDSQAAQVIFSGQVKAKINYAEPKEKRLVKEVLWLDGNGNVRACDHYDRYGMRFAQTTYDEAKRPIIKTYYDPEQREVLVQNFVTGDLLLTKEGQTLNFKNLTELTLFYLKERKYELEQIFINSLSYPFFVLLQLKETGNDILFWQEELATSIPGNMQMILNGQVPRIKQIIIQDAVTYEKALQLSEHPEYFTKLGFIYPQKRTNQQRKQLLTLTNSDQLEQLEALSSALPEFEFHIAALTEMSPKLLRLGQQQNIMLYPNIAPAQLTKLFAQTDFYLDINHQQELLLAGRQAYENEMLILGFENTVHARHFTAPENIYAPTEVGELVQKLKRATGDKEYLHKLLEAQRKQAQEETPTTYQSNLRKRSENE